MPCKGEMHDVLGLSLPGCMDPETMPYPVIEVLSFLVTI